jgi:hypothetical protein
MGSRLPLSKLEGSRRQAFSSRPLAPKPPEAASSGPPMCQVEGLDPGRDDTTGGAPEPSTRSRAETTRSLATSSSLPGHASSPRDPRPDLAVQQPRQIIRRPPEHAQEAAVNAPEVMERAQRHSPRGFSPFPTAARRGGAAASSGRPRASRGSPLRAGRRRGPPGRSGRGDSPAPRAGRGAAARAAPRRWRRRARRGPAPPGRGASRSRPTRADRPGTTRQLFSGERRELERRRCVADRPDRGRRFGGGERGTHRTHHRTAV